MTAPFSGSFQWRPRATASHNPQMPLAPFRPALSCRCAHIHHRPDQLPASLPALGRPSSLPTRPHTRVAPDRHLSPSSPTLARSTSNNISYESPYNIRPLLSPSSLPFDHDAISLHPTTATTSLPFLSSTRRLHTVYRDRNRTPALGPSAITTLHPTPSPPIETASCCQSRALSPSN